MHDVSSSIRRGLLVLGLGILAGGAAVACGAAGDEGQAGQGAEATAADSAAERRDRPGPLRAVDRAREVSDSMASRAARMDSAG